jgi:Skp family chaperone for outer membrane proteins
MRLFPFLILLLIVLTPALQAQKFGHVNSMEILLLLPEIAEADSVLAIYQEEILVKGDSMVDAFRTKYQQYMQDAQAGSLSKMQAQSLEAQLTREQQEIQAYEREAQNLIYQRRHLLYEPILNRVDELIKLIGEEQQYAMIFDTSSPAVVFIQDSEDITQKILARLYPK